MATGFLNIFKDNDSVITQRNNKRNQQAIQPYFTKMEQGLIWLTLHKETGIIQHIMYMLPYEGGD